MSNSPLRDELANRIREVIGYDPNVTEKAMFGGIAFMLNGNMLVGPHKDGSMMARVGKELEAEALSRPHAREMDFTGRPMSGFVTVDPPGLESEDDLAGWIALSTQFVGALPAK
jgi:hypothetical protein